jgi:hypothetical protein
VIRLQSIRKVPTPQSSQKSKPVINLHNQGSKAAPQALPTRSGVAIEKSFPTTKAANIPREEADIPKGKRAIITDLNC